MRTLVEGTDHRRCPQRVKLSDDDARRAHDVKCNGATFEELPRHFRVRTGGSTWDIAWNALGLPNRRHQR
jgi:hypothetical protein